MWKTNENSHFQNIPLGNTGLAMLSSVSRESFQIIFVLTAGGGATGRCTRSGAMSCCLFHWFVSLILEATCPKAQNLATDRLPQNVDVMNTTQCLNSTISEDLSLTFETRMFLATKMGMSNHSKWNMYVCMIAPTQGGTSYATWPKVGFLKLGLVKKLRFLGHLWTDLANFGGDLWP